jgi:hypothetical protein
LRIEEAKRKLKVRSGAKKNNQKRRVAEKIESHF